MSYSILEPAVRGDRIRKPVLTQGAIVAGVRIPRYPALAHHALVITARCDLEHVRSDVINALPIVPLRAWCDYDGMLASIATRVSKLTKDALALMRALGPRVPELFGSSSHEWLDTFEQFVRPNDALPKNQTNQLENVLKEMRGLQSALSRVGHDHDSFLAAHAEIAACSVQCSRTKAQKRVEDLLKHQVADAHFLPLISDVESPQTCDGYVVLFRHILAIPGAGLHQLANGGVPSISNGDAHFVSPPGAVRGLLGNLASPYLEHILQRFAHLYTRIGVSDFDDAYIGRVARIGVTP